MSVSARLILDVLRARNYMYTDNVEDNRCPTCNGWRKTDGEFFCVTTVGCATCEGIKAASHTRERVQELLLKPSTKSTCGLICRQGVNRDRFTASGANAGIFMLNFRHVVRDGDVGPHGLFSLFTAETRPKAFYTASKRGAAAVDARARQRTTWSMMFGCSPG